jgi:hypothetical protein
MPYIDEADSDTLDLIENLKILGPDRRESGMGYGDIMKWVETLKELKPKEYNEDRYDVSRIKQAWADEGELWKRVANGELLVSRYAGHGEFIEGPYKQLKYDDLAILPRKESKTREANQPATYIKVKKASGKVLAHSILVGANPFAPRPLTVEVDGETWSIDLTRSRYSLPFGIELEKFEKEDHPGTDRAREYSSDVFRVDGGQVTDKYHISMNKPMRYGGFTLYQASWGPPGAKPGDRLYTSLAVSRNPADQWPKYGTYVVAVGMSIHFLQKLFAYLRRSSRSREKKEVKP